MCLPWKDNLLWTSVDLPVLDIFYEWNHTMCDPCNWLSVSLMFSRFIHVTHASDLIPFYWWTVFHCMVIPQFILFIHQSMDIWVVSAFSFYECKHSCKFLCECMFSFLLDIYLLGVELLGHMLILCANTLATWCKELTHWKRPWCWERSKAGEERDDRGWDGWMASLTGWTWVLASSRSWWWTRRSGVL